MDVPTRDRRARLRARSLARRGKRPPPWTRCVERSRVWQQLGAPYLAARLRVLLARAVSRSGDTEGARLELEGARESSSGSALGPTLPSSNRSTQARAANKHSPDARGSTERELQVLRLVARGKTNKGIARELSLSEKTIDRHVSNIFTKLDVSSRAAATAFAYEHELL